METQEAREAVRERRLGRLTRRAWRRRLLNMFLVWHLCALTLWLLPGNLSVVQRFVSPTGGPVRSYLTWTNFNQGWNMFSPEPDRLDVWVEGRATCADGSVRRFAFPRMVDMGFVDRYRRERWRKWIEVSHQDRNAPLWPILARYAARRCEARPVKADSRPVKVELVRHWRTVPPPGRPMPPFQQYVFYSLPMEVGSRS